MQLLLIQSQTKTSNKNLSNVKFIAASSIWLQLIDCEKFDIYEYMEYYGTTESGDQYTEKERDEELQTLKDLLELMEQDEGEEYNVKKAAELGGANRRT